MHHHLMNRVPWPCVRHTLIAACVQTFFVLRCHTYFDLSALRLAKVNLSMPIVWWSLLDLLSKFTVFKMTSKVKVKAKVSWHSVRPHTSFWGSKIWLPMQSLTDWIFLILQPWRLTFRPQNIGSPAVVVAVASLVTWFVVDLTCFRRLTGLHAR